jgi:hypothetical protein
MAAAVLARAGRRSGEPDPSGRVQE